ncbi:MAG: diacylglycerol kinase family lipid kinase [Gemmatimonadetes bacterium]|nr:diacylglycerol kinase family lipid kinase [Gemmatimonadota bacterium]
MTSSRPDARVIVNPAAGGGAAARLWPELERELGRRGLEIDIARTTGRGHGVELARAAAEAGTRLVIAVGGDGTVHEVANGLLRAFDADGARSTLGVVPVGTGNDFVKMLGDLRDRRRAYDTLVTGVVQRFDVGVAEWDGGSEFFVNGLGTGVDVEVVRQIQRLPRLPGVLGYLLGLMRAVWRFRAIPLRIRLDGQEREKRLMLLAVTNGRCIGGGFHICPSARPDDGRFDVCVVDELSRLQIARVIPRVLRGTHGGLPMVELRQASFVEIEAMGPEALFFQLDGELREPGTRRVRVRIRPAALPVLLPADRGGRA